MELICSFESNIFSTFEPKPVEGMISELRQLFLEGRASPFDIDENGQNLIHNAIQAALRWNSPESFAEIIVFLKKCGTDVNSTDLFGCSPLACYLSGRLFFSRYLTENELSPFDTLSRRLAETGAIAVADSSLFSHLHMNKRHVFFAQEMIQNLRASEELAEDVLKCGPLSMAVLQKSEPLVRYHLQNPATIREKNAAGHSPLHLCGDWTKGIGLLLEAGFPCNVIDNSHMTPLDYTISVQGDADTTTMLLKAGSPPTRCENLHTSSSTLDRALEATLDPPVLTLGQLPLSLNKNIACLIENLKCRRESLAALAKARLPECVLSELGTLGTVIDDSRAHCTWRALEDRNVSIPTSLDTHGVSIYHQVRNKNLAKYLYDMGFKSLDEYDHRGMTPLMSLAHRLRTHNGVFENSANFDEMFDLAEWFLLQGADPLRPGRDLDVNALHVAAHGVRFRIYRETLPQEQGLIRHPPVRKILEKQWIDPVILGTNSQYDSVLSPLLLLIIEKVSPTCIDSCLCGCSLYGCTPTTVFLKGMNFFYWRYCNSMFLYEVSALLYNWYNALAAVGLTASDIRKEVERCIAFKKLGLTHTCCKPHLMVDYYGDPFNWKRFPDDDADEIREEEEELLSQLENMLQERDSEWWNSPSNLDFLLDVCSEGPPPTLRWANLWLLQRTYGIDEEACEELRRMAGIPEERFWTSPWKVPDIRGELQGWEVPKRYSKDRHKGAVKQMPRVY